MTTNENNTASATTDTPTLVLGGTGKTGRRVAERLTALGRSVRIGSRTAAVPFDWTDRATWQPALDGIDSVYISYQPDIAAPGGAEEVGAFAELAAAAGVRHLVLLSGRGEPEAQDAEARVRAAGTFWTVVRASFFAQNFDEGEFLGPVLSGEVALPVGAVGEPFIDVDDIADVAVAALTEDGHAGQVYEVTGPRLLTFADAIAEIARASGRDITFVQVPLEAYTAVLTEYGVPAEVIDLLAFLFGEVLDGRNAHVSDGVQRALGRAPRDFSDYANEAAARGIWKV
ncbi:NAD(P)H-binding protein [Streptomyces sp. SID3343]|uniref:NAD(P)H-binding protein n=1 Tax=Streptomyces sp. SID3343 TaxID=2690260 RepID=UPI00136FB0BC|nr:NAD(P)H-binding protein [Streptomyces sp. SID3343]MYW05002.1 NAD(P)H-binding protein [Streptomyces sp. SID3343]